MIGKILGKRYQITEKIDVGGMSTVYKALDFNLKRYDAVKILKEEYSSNPEFVEKFRQEANSVANLNHPNVVNIYNVGSEGNLQYIVMEFVKGRTLKQIIKEKGRLFQDQVINYSEQIARGLQHAHLNGIIHRDIKPQNIMITDDDRVKVTDFGIAKSSESSTITNSGRIVGSVHYFSPEQARGLMTDRRSDIYSLGIVMYEMVTGRLPFDSESPVTIALKHMQEPIIPPKTINNQISDKLNAVIMKATQKDPLDRYQSMDEMVTDIQRIKSGEGLIYAVSKREIEPLDKGTTQIMTPIRTSASPISRAVHNVKSPLKDRYDFDEDDFESLEKKEKNRSRIYLISMLLLIAALTGIVVWSYNYFKNANEQKRLAEQNGQYVTVPKLMGLLPEQATEKLKELGLPLNIAGSKDSDAPGGSILETNPGPGTKVAKGTVINVIISSQVTAANVPDLVGKTVEEGRDILLAQGFKVGKTVETESSTIDEGLLVGTNPPAGQTKDLGGTIELLVAIPKKAPKEVTVPDLLGLDQKKAQEEITKAHMKLGTLTYVATSDKNQDKKLLEQSLYPGNKATEGSKIDIKIGKYSENATPFIASGNGETVEVTHNNNATTVEGTATNNNENTKAPDGSFDMSLIIGKSFNEASGICAQYGYSIDIMNLTNVDGSPTPSGEISALMNSGSVDAYVTEGFVSGSTVIVNCMSN